MVFNRKYCDCEQCSLSWENRSYEGECLDYGCYAYRDLYGDKFICYLPGFIKRRIADIKKKRILRAEEKELLRMQKEENGEIVNWFVSQERKDAALRKAIEEILFKDQYDGKRFLCYEWNGVLFKYYDIEAILLCETPEIRRMYEKLLTESEGQVNK